MQPQVSVQCAHSSPVRCRVAGAVVGWVSSAFYVGSRVSQIVKNAQRRSAEGLALSMFVAAICANCFYGAGVPPRQHLTRHVSMHASMTCEV